MPGPTLLLTPLLPLYRPPPRRALGGRGVRRTAARADAVGAQSLDLGRDRVRRRRRGAARNSSIHTAQLFDSHRAIIPFTGGGGDERRMGRLLLAPRARVGGRRRGDAVRVDANRALRRRRCDPRLRRRRPRIVRAAARPPRRRRHPALRRVLKGLHGGAGGVRAGGGRRRRRGGRGVLRGHRRASDLVHPWRVAHGVPIQWEGVPRDGPRAATVGRR